MPNDDFFITVILSYMTGLNEKKILKSLFSKKFQLCMVDCFFRNSAAADAGEMIPNTLKYMKQKLLR